jgi:hypothetical protein
LNHCKRTANSAVVELVESVVVLVLVLVLVLVVVVVAATDWVGFAPGFEWTTRPTRSKKVTK